MSPSPAGPSSPDEGLERTRVNTIRMLAADMIEKAKSGHPGLPMGAATLAYALWTTFLRHDPKEPRWPDRDRFVLSAGHGSALLYAMLHLTGYDLSLDDLKAFRQLGSRTPGHPEPGLTPGVETVTGPLGQGLGNAVGMALAERWLAARYNRPGHEIVDHVTYVLASDGDMMEGISSEAASLAGHLRLGKLIVVYDDNKISIEGGTSLAFTEDVGARFKAFGWAVQRIDGNDVKEIERALQRAREDASRPSLIVARTHIGFGSPGRQDTPKAHGEPLGAAELAATKKNLGWPLEPAFHIPEESAAFFRRAVEKGARLRSDWEKRWKAYAEAFPRIAEEWETAQRGALPREWDADIPIFHPDTGPLSTRKASGKALNALAGRVPWLVGGSADLAPSNNTLIDKGGDVAAGRFEGRNLRFGIREHAMGAIVNGMTLHGGMRVYGATFLTFSDYFRPALRLAALAKIPSIFVLTHDSIAVGEDGPTHQPVEHLAALRAIPNMVVLRPADANETAEAWRLALTHGEGPVLLILSRQDLPILEPKKGLLPKGAYVLKEAPDGKPDMILLATGSEVSLALEARETLAAEGIGARVVSMPSWELFEAQPQEYKDSVLPPGLKARLAVEAGVSQGWQQYVGSRKNVVGVERFGASAPGPIVMKDYGFTAANVAARAKAILEK
ncbi:MAG: transketolase [Elusimicrobiota bacterium]